MTHGQSTCVRHENEVRITATASGSFNEKSNLQAYFFISVVVCTYKSPKLLAKCLDSLARVDYPKDRFEVIVVDDGLLPETRSVVELFPDFKFVQRVDTTSANAGGPSVGLAASRDVGVGASTGELVAFLDDDATAPKNWLAAIDDRFRTDSTIMCVGGPDVPPDDDSYFGKSSALVEEYSKSHLFALKGEMSNPGPIKGVNMIFRRSVFPKIGNFGSPPDSEYVHRMLRNGMKVVYDPKIFVYHYRHSLGYTLRKYVRTLGTHRTLVDAGYRLPFLYLALCLTPPSLSVINRTAFLACSFLYLAVLISLSLHICASHQGCFYYLPGVTLAIVVSILFHGLEAIDYIIFRMLKVVKNSSVFRIVMSSRPV